MNAELLAKTQGYSEMGGRHVRAPAGRVVLLLTVCLAGCAADRSKAEPVARTEQRFDYYYLRWQRECERISFSSRTQDYTGLPAFRSIIALGRPALPYLQQKMEEDFMLAQAVVEICGWKPEEFPHESEQEFRDKVLAKLRAGQQTGTGSAPSPASDRATLCYLDRSVSATGPMSSGQ